MARRKACSESGIAGLPDAGTAGILKRFAQCGEEYPPADAGKDDYAEASSTTATTVFEPTGGEIKNVILNAARLALCRDPQGKLTMADFRKAIEMEVSGGWTKEERLGFG